MSVRERPAIFQGWGVRAIRADLKVQTRRIVKPRCGEDRCSSDCAGPEWDRAWVDPGLRDGAYLHVPCADGAAQRVRCRYGDIGDRLWVRETMAIETCREIGWYEPPFNDGRPIRHHEDSDGRWWEQAHYRATDPDPDLFYEDAPSADPRVRWTPSIHMPRWASRVLLEITDIRVQRLQEISASDAWSEGVGAFAESLGQDSPAHAQAVKIARMRGLNEGTGRDSIAWFSVLWDLINGKRGAGWLANPLVWALTFKRVEQVAA